MRNNPLGKKTEYQSNYNPSILFPINREINRIKIGIKKSVFTGYDIWNCYEVSFLNEKGKPEVRRISIIYSSDSECIVESKSLKLYLGSFIMTKFKNGDEVIKTIKNDLKNILKPQFIEVSIYDYKNEIKYSKIPDKLLIDDLDVEITDYELNPSLLKTERNDKNIIEHYSNLLKTNCPITNQPDWGTVYIKYKSEVKLVETSLLKYIISFRNHNDYHESCCETIFNDIFNLIKPSLLTVKCFFTRRGGLDINPARFYGEQPDNLYNLHYWRQ